MPLFLKSGEVAQWLAPRIFSVNREVGSSNLTVSTDVNVVDALLRLRAYAASRSTQPNVKEELPIEELPIEELPIEELPIAAKSRANKLWTTIT